MLTVYKELQKGRYKITKQIGQEQSISFYKAFDKVLGKSVLLKEIPINSDNLTKQSEKEDAKQAFIAEAISLMKINHEGIIRMYDFFTDIDYQYLSMELVDGEHLEELFKNNRIPIAIANVVNWGEQILESLEYLHNQKPQVIYSKVRPKNLYLTSSGKIKLLAMGIGETNNSTSNQSLIEQTSNTDNINYSPLEIIWGKLDSASQRVILNSFEEKSKQLLLKKPDVRSDVYSLGTTLYHLATGKSPIDALERSINILENKPDPLTPPHEINREISLEISEVLMKAVEINRENRFESTAKMQAELVNAFVKQEERNANKLKPRVPNVSEVPALNQTPAETKIEPEKRVVAEIKSGENREFIPTQPISQKVQKPLVAKPPAETVSVENEMANLKRAENSKLILELPEESFEVPEKLELSEKLAEVTEKPLETPKMVAEQIEPAYTEKQEETEEIFEEETVSDVVEEEETISDVVETDEVEIKDNVVEFVQKDSEIDFENMFTKPKKERKTLKRLAAAAAVLMLMGGGTWGVLHFASSKAAEANQVISNPISPVEETTATEQTDENIPDSALEYTEAETNEETSAQTNEDSPEKSADTNAPTNLNQTRAKVEAEKKKPTIVSNEESAKDTPGLPETESEKTTEKRPQTANNKKRVTVDDLINDTPKKKKKVTVDDLIGDN